MRFELVDSYSVSAVIHVFGIGVAGSQAVRHKLAGEIKGAEFAVVERGGKNDRGLTVFPAITHGHSPPTDDPSGQGGNGLHITYASASKSFDDFGELLEGSDLVFLVADLGCQEDIILASRIAKVGKEGGILLIAVLSEPFAFEGEERRSAVDVGYRRLLPEVDVLLVARTKKNIGDIAYHWDPEAAFEAGCRAILDPVRAITDLITRPSLISIDYSDVRITLEGRGRAVIGVGISEGEGRARNSAIEAVNEILVDTDMAQATGILVDIAASCHIEIGEYGDVGDVVREHVSEAATVIIGTNVYPELDGKLKVIIVAAGVGV